MFKGTNRVYKITITDTEGNTVLPVDIAEMDIIVYNDRIKQRELLYTKTVNAGSDGSITVDGNQHKFEVESSHSNRLNPGKYMIQIKYARVDAEYTGNKVDVSERELFILKDVISE